MELLLTYFFEWCICFFKYLTNSTTVKQSTIKIRAEALIFEKEKGIVLFSTVKLEHFYTNDCSIVLKPSAADKFSHKIL